MSNKRAFSLVELLISLFISVLLLSSIAYIFNKFYSKLYASFLFQRSESSLLYISEILDHDILKAGYHYDGPGEPVMWDSSAKELSIKFVDYEKSGCEDKKWSDNEPSCNYEIDYYLSNNQLIRSVDKDANGTTQSSTILPPEITVLDFNVNLNKPIIAYNVKVRIPSILGTKDIEISNVVLCHNWQ